ncbi:hypothetical protein K438DRAFT_1847701 [Mycena galopus ATCC 62051]|nr:hypothetical protein K438DRAFT_1847701 [Mycena galopus ATCC 62051]
MVFIVLVGPFVRLAVTGLGVGFPTPRAAQPSPRRLAVRPVVLDWVILLVDPFNVQKPLYPQIDFFQSVRQSTLQSSAQPASKVHFRSAGETKLELDSLAAREFASQDRCGPPRRKVVDNVIKRLPICKLPVLILEDQAKNQFRQVGSVFELIDEFFRIRVRSHPKSERFEGHERGQPAEHGQDFVFIGV